MVYYETMQTRRKNLKTLGFLGVGALFGIGASFKSSNPEAQESNNKKTLETILYAEFSKQGVDLQALIKALGKQDEASRKTQKETIEKLTNPNQWIYSPLSILHYHITHGERVELPPPEFVGKLRDIEALVNSANEQKIKSIYATLPREGKLTPNAVRSYFDLSTHLNAIQISSNIIPQYFNPQTTEQQAQVNAYINSLQSYVSSVKQDPRIIYVSSNLGNVQTQSEYPVGEWIDFGEIRLNETQRNVRNMIIATVNQNFPELKNEIDTLLWIAWYESWNPNWKGGFYPNAVSPTEAKGLFQFVKTTWWYCQGIDIRDKQKRRGSSRSGEIIANKIRASTNIEPTNYPLRFGHNDYRFEPKLNIIFACALYLVEGGVHWNESKSKWNDKVRKGIRFPRD